MTLKANSVSKSKPLATPPKPPEVCVIYDASAMHVATHLLNECGTGEVQWFHRVARTETDDGKLIFRLYDIFIPPQEVSSATVDSDPEHMVALYDEIEELCTDDDGNINDDQVNRIIQSMTAWCHSHVKMACTPSGTDEAQIKERVETAEFDGIDAPQIMLIMNQNEQYYIRIYDPQSGWIFTNPKLVIYNTGAEFDYVRDALKNKITRKSYTSKNSGSKQASQGGSSTNPRKPAGGQRSPATTTTTTTSGTTRPTSTSTPGEAVVWGSNFEELQFFEDEKAGLIQAGFDINSTSAINIEAGLATLEEAVAQLTSQGDNDDIWHYLGIFLLDETENWNRRFWESTAQSQLRISQDQLFTLLRETHLDYPELMPSFIDVACVLAWSRTAAERGALIKAYASWVDKYATDTTTKDRPPV